MSADQPPDGASSAAPGTALSKPARSFYIGVSGNLALTMEDGTTTTFANVPVGIFPVSAAPRSGPLASVNHCVTGLAWPGAAFLPARPDAAFCRAREVRAAAVVEVVMLTAAVVVATGAR